MIVVAIMSLVAAGVAIAAIQQAIEAKKRMTKTNLIELRKMAGLYMENEGSCPTPMDLQHAKLIDVVSKTRDPWGSEYRIACTDDEIRVSSAGPDRKEGTEDDIHVP